MNDTHTCEHTGCGRAFEPTKPEQRFCTAKCRAAASREKALAGPRSRITGGPRKNKRGVSITLTFTGDDAVRALAFEPGQALHVYPAAPDTAGNTSGGDTP